MKLKILSLNVDIFYESHLVPFETNFFSKNDSIYNRKETLNNASLIFLLVYLLVIIGFIIIDFSFI